MSTWNNKCILILPYFGKFNNYFSLFLLSCARNPSYDWLIFTDDSFEYDCPQNVHVVRMTLDDVKKVANEKFGFNVTLNSPYKLCDYKPTYGFLFEDYIKDYAYWGHCDCDVIFGNLEKLLTPLLNKGYDKLFAAGHLTIYRNEYFNNRRFMKPLNGRILYKEVLSTDDICAFDEDCRGHNNVHTIFLNDGAMVYDKDLSMNPTSRSARFQRAFYEPEVRKYIIEEYTKARYYWSNGNMIRIECGEGRFSVNEYLYIHLQMRKMRVKFSNADSFEILPDRFVSVEKLPASVEEMKSSTIGFPYLYWYDVYKKKIKNKISKIAGKNSKRNDKK